MSYNEARELLNYCDDPRANQLYALALRLYATDANSIDAADAFEVAKALHAKSLNITVPQLEQDIKDKALDPVVRRIVKLAQEDESDAYDDNRHSTVAARLHTIHTVLKALGRLDLWKEGRRIAKQRVKYEWTHKMMDRIERGDQ